MTGLDKGLVLDHGHLDDLARESVCLVKYLVDLHSGDEDNLHRLPGRANRPSDLKIGVFQSTQLMKNPQLEKSNWGFGFYSRSSKSRLRKIELRLTTRLVGV